MEEQINPNNQVSQTLKKEWIKPEWEIVEINGGPNAFSVESAIYHIAS